MVEGLSSYDQMASSEADMTHDQAQARQDLVEKKLNGKHSLCVLYSKLLNPTSSLPLTFLTRLICMQMIS